MYGWLGGTDQEKEGECTWTDGSKWSVEQWLPGRPQDGSGLNCLFSRGSEGWHDALCESELYFICNLPTVKTLKSPTKVVFTSENISTIPAIQVRWVAQPVSEDGVALFDTALFKKNEYFA